MCESSENRPRYTFHEITHSLSSPQDESESEDSETSATCIVGNHSLAVKPVTRVGVKGVKEVSKDPAVPAMESHTSFEGNRSRVGVTAVRTKPAAPVMKSLTICQTNSTRLEMKAVRADTAALVWNHSQTVK